MYTKQLLIGVLATLLTFGLFGTAFASESGTLHSDQAIGQKTHNPDKVLVYVQEGSEAGSFHLMAKNSEIKTTGSDDRVYVQRGSEAGDWNIKCSTC